MAHNLNALEVLFMHFVHERKETEVTNSSQWLHRYSTNPNTLINSLTKNNVIRKTKDLDVLLPDLKVPELKDILRNNNLKISGNKPNLIERIIQNSDKIDIDLSQYSSVYVVTDEYEDLLAETKFIQYFDRMGIIDIFDAYDYYLKYPNKSSENIVIDILNKKLNSVTDTHDQIHIYKILSDKYYELNDEYSAQYHLHNSEMLRILEQIERHRENISYGIYLSVEDNPYLFFVNNNTILQYKTLLRTRQLTLNDLKEELISSSKHLNYTSKDKELAADYLVAVVNDDFDASKILINKINKDNKSRKSAPRQRTNPTVKIELKQSSQNHLPNTTKKKTAKKKTSGSGCIIFLALPGIPMVAYILQNILF